MGNNNEVDIILEKTINKFKEMFKESLQSVILYGSYARGDYDSESDIDIVALVDIGRPLIKNYFDDVVKFSSLIDLEYGIMLSPSVIPYEEYLKFKNDLPYYANIAKEGVVLSAK